MITYIDSIPDAELRDKKVLLRVDFNVPVAADGKTIADTFRIRAVIPTLKYLLDNGAQVLLVSHITAVESFNNLVSAIAEVLGMEIKLAHDIGQEDFTKGSLWLLDNIRRYSGEEQNLSELAQHLADGFDLYVNDAFAVCHRAHASVVAITKLLPSYGGLLLRSEIEHLSQVLRSPAAGKTMILGGAKIATKLPVIKNFLDKAEHILIGGALANNFFKARGLGVGTSLIDPDFMSVADLEVSMINIPSDIGVASVLDGSAGVTYQELDTIAADQAIIDIGPKTQQHYSQIVTQSSMVIWNGPMGLSEVASFAVGTEAIAQAVAANPHALIGGGDTIGAVAKLGLLNKYSFVSTGGGAMLEFLAGVNLPGLVALGYDGASTISS